MHVRMSICFFCFFYFDQGRRSCPGASCKIIAYKVLRNEVLQKWQGFWLTSSNKHISDVEALLCKPQALAWKLSTHSLVILAKPWYFACTMWIDSIKNQTKNILWMTLSNIWTFVHARYGVVMIIIRWSPSWSSLLFYSSS